MCPAAKWLDGASRQVPSHPSVNVINVAHFRLKSKKFLLKNLTISNDDDFLHMLPFASRKSLNSNYNSFSDGGQVSSHSHTLDFFSPSPLITCICITIIITIITTTITTTTCNIYSIYSPINIRITTVTEYAIWKFTSVTLKRTN